MTNVTSTGAEAGVIEVNLSGTSEISQKTGVEPQFLDSPPSCSVQNGEPVGTPPEDGRFKSEPLEAEQAADEPIPSESKPIPASEGRKFDSLGLSADLLKAVEQSGYTPPTPTKAPPSPLWVPVVMATLLLTGLVVIVGNYMSLLPGDTSNRYLMLGLLLVVLGFILATTYR